MNFIATVSTDGTPIGSAKSIEEIRNISRKWWLSHRDGADNSTLIQVYKRDPNGQYKKYLAINPTLAW